MVFFLLQPEAILTSVSRVYKGCITQRADLFYDGCLVPFIGPSGALLRLGLQGGSYMAESGWSRSPPPSVRPWTRSIVDKCNIPTFYNVHKSLKFKTFVLIKIKY